jgi:hypothetical protein
MRLPTAASSVAGASHPLAWSVSAGIPCQDFSTETRKSGRTKRRVYTDPPKPWYQKDHPLMPWAAALLALWLLALSFWFALPSIKAARGESAQPVKISSCI